MRNFKNNFRRNRYKNHSDRNHKKNGSDIKLINDLQNGHNFIRKNPNRNNHNASKLVEKYSNLAREALSNGDKILSENYFQHAEHFIRIIGEKESLLNKQENSKSLNKSSNGSSLQEKDDQDKKNTENNSPEQNITSEN